MCRDTIVYRSYETTGAGSTSMCIVYMILRDYNFRVQIVHMMWMIYSETLRGQPTHIPGTSLRNDSMSRNLNSSCKKLNSLVITEKDHTLSTSHGKLIVLSSTMNRFCFCQGFNIYKMTGRNVISNCRKPITLAGKSVLLFSHSPFLID